PTAAKARWNPCCWPPAERGLSRRATVRPLPALRQKTPSPRMRAEKKERLSSCLHPRGLLDRLPDALVGPASADIALHERVDLAMLGLGLGLQQRRRLHDLAGLTIAALGYVAGLPGFLNGMIAVSAEAFNGCDPLFCCRAHRGDTTARRLAVHVDRASAAQP